MTLKGLFDLVRLNTVSELWATISQLRAKDRIFWQRKAIDFIEFFISELTATRQLLHEEQSGRFLRRPKQDYPAATVAEFSTAVLSNCTGQQDGPPNLGNAHQTAGLPRSGQGDDGMNFMLNLR